ncbi:hypothetical protein A3731_17370 [Roseovarius sp. HI0049]|nr:hypothetical protein A3731_17370 [Roseovarius sp. HI0049]
MMDFADSPRRGDRDGRGKLSETALKTFSEWYLKVTLGQIAFRQNSSILANWISGIVVLLQKPSMTSERRN